MPIRHPLTRVLPLGLVLALSACSSDQLLLQKRVDYRSASTNVNENGLEVPPDLTRPAAGQTGASVSARSLIAQTGNTSGNAVVPALKDAKLMRSGAQRWLVINRPPEQVWNELREFWQGNGFALSVDNPQAGLMETDWQENRAKLPGDLITKLLSKVAGSFLSTGELDSYRIRIERGEQPGSSEIFLTHRGLIEVFRENGATAGNVDSVLPLTSNASTVWTPRASDPQLEGQMLALLLQHLGLPQAQAEQVVSRPQTTDYAKLVTENGQPRLQLQDGFDRAWRRVALALESNGYQIVDRNRQQGVFIVERTLEQVAREEDKGFFASLAFWNKEGDGAAVARPQFDVKLSQAGNGSTLQVSARDAAQQADAQRMLTMLLGQLK